MIREKPRKTSLLLIFTCLWAFTSGCNPGETCENGGYYPTAEEELLSKIIIRHFIQNEGDLRKYMSYDKALLKTPNPTLIRLSFHMNMQKSDGCLDETNNFANGLQNITHRIGLYYELFEKTHKLMKDVHTYVNLNGWDGTDISKAAERECARRTWNQATQKLCLATCDTVEEQVTEFCHGKLSAWRRTGFENLVLNLGDEIFWQTLGFKIPEEECEWCDNQRMESFTTAVYQGVRTARFFYTTHCLQLKTILLETTYGTRLVPRARISKIN